MLSQSEKLILRILDKASEPMYGLDIIEESNGVLKRATVYVQLGRLEDADLVSSCLEEKSVRPNALLRRLYKISPSGRERLIDIDGEVPALAF